MPDAPALTCSHKMILVGDAKGKRSARPRRCRSRVYVSRVRFAGGELDGLEVAATPEQAERLPGMSLSVTPGGRLSTVNGSSTRRRRSAAPARPTGYGAAGPFLTGMAGGEPPAALTVERTLRVNHGRLARRCATAPGGDRHVQGSCCHPVGARNLAQAC